MRILYYNFCVFSSATIFAPTDNAFVLKKMRRLLTRDEIHGLIDSMLEENGLMAYILERIDNK